MAGACGRWAPFFIGLLAQRGPDGPRGPAGTVTLCLNSAHSVCVAGAKEIDIAATLEHLRDQRPGMVQTKVPQALGPGQEAWPVVPGPVPPRPGPSWEGPW